jgi:hypothetical protein
MGKSKADKAREAKNARRRAAYAAKKDAETKGSKSKAKPKPKPKPEPKSVTVKLRVRSPERKADELPAPAGGFYEPAEGADDHRGLFDGA